MTQKKGFELIAHLQGEYENWYNASEDKKNTRNWKEFVKQSVKVNNDYNGTEDDFVFTAEDAMHHLD